MSTQQSDENVITDCKYEVEEVGRAIKSTKKKHKWQFSIRGNKHYVELLDSRLSGKKKIVADGLVVLGAQVFKNLFSHAFQLGTSTIAIVQSGNSFELRINNFPFQHLLELQKNKQFFKPEPTSQTYQNSKIVENPSKKTVLNLNDIAYANSENKENSGINSNNPTPKGGNTKLFTFNIKPTDKEKRKDTGEGLSSSSPVNNINKFDRKKMEEFYHKTGQHSLVNKNSGVNLLGLGEQVNILEISPLATPSGENKISYENGDTKEKNEKNDLINMNSQNGNTNVNFQNKNSFDELNDLFSTSPQDNTLKPIREVDKVGVIKELYQQTFNDSKKEESTADPKKRVAEFINSPHQLPLLGMYGGTASVFKVNPETEKPKEKKDVGYFDTFGGFDFGTTPKQRTQSTNDLIDISIIGNKSEEDSKAYKNHSTKTLTNCLENLNFGMETTNVNNSNNVQADDLLSFDSKIKRQNTYPTFDNVDFKFYNNVNNNNNVNNAVKTEVSNANNTKNNLDFFD